MQMQVLLFGAATEFSAAFATTLPALRFHSGLRVGARLPCQRTDERATADIVGDPACGNTALQAGPASACAAVARIAAFGRPFASYAVKMLAPDDIRVASGDLGPVKCDVGCFCALRQRRSGLGSKCNAGREGQRDALQFHNAVGGKFVPPPGTSFERLVAARARQHDEEFLAAMTERHFRAVQAVAEDACETRQDLVSDIVPVPVIDLLEVIEIQDDQRYRRVLARAGDNGRDDGAGVTPIV